MNEYLILISHGFLCTELKKSVEMIMGSQAMIHAIPLLPSEGQADFLAKFKKETEDITSFTVFADLMGGTPCNVAAKLILTGEKFDLYAGMNMPMIIDFINSQMMAVKSDFVVAAKESIVYVNEIILNQEDAEE
ncbi:PTS sugar transporter subunit IIA [Enterococcus songbeiensis]|uniref:PTS sugar transporter subunit IIA n=1 Tax=Enterococcus songbeiensis TaxID=2559927 RepID=UPI0010F8FA1C|nr:PTS fructose transporter subunit IIA [Enterococcus songbeiensis]